MPKRSSSTAEVLLGLLTIEPMSGYDLGRAIRDSVGHFWNESYGQIYPTLKRLAGERFVTSKLERQAGKPDRRIYSITKKGRERLRNWLAVPPQPEIPRNELLLKLFFGEQVSANILIEHVKRMVNEYRTVLAFLDTVERKEIVKYQDHPASPFWKIAVHFGQMEMRAHLRWAEETISELSKIDKKRERRSDARREKRHV
jgi:DNA-binding PadR family transcriptional regulator